MDFAGAGEIVLPVCVHSNSDYSLGSKAQIYAGNFVSSKSSVAWRAAKRVMYVPFGLPTKYYCRRMMWINGNTASGNVDCGIYQDGVRLYHTGSVAQAGTTAMQISSAGGDLLLDRGNYYWAITLDGTTGTLEMWSYITLPLSSVRTHGVLYEDTGSFGLPATWTPATILNGEYPFIGMTDTASEVF